MNQQMEGRAQSKIRLLVAVAAVLVVSVQSVAVDWVSDPLPDSVRVQATLGNFLENNVVSAVDTLLDTAADTEMGSDLGTDRLSGDDGPATLAEYCAGPTKSELHEGVAEGDKVKGNWRGYGTYYPGVVKKKRSNGTTDILYDDGFTEKRVKAGAMKDVKDKKEDETEEKPKPRDDAACELQEFIDKLKGKFGELSADLSQWLMAQRAKVAKGEHPEPPPTMAAEAEEAAPAVTGNTTAPAPAPAVANAMDPPAGLSPDRKTQELEKLKKQLADRDEYITKLEEQTKENDKVLAKVKGEVIAEGPAPAVVKTVDDLIAEYRAKVASRDKAIERLKAKIAQQLMELATLGASQISLHEISAGIAQLSEEADTMEAKRLELKKNGKLDGDLAHIIESIVKAIKKMESKVAQLLVMEEHAKTKKAAAEFNAASAERKAIAQAKLKAEKEGKHQDEVKKDMEIAAKAARKQSEEEGKAAEMETLQAAQEMEAELKDAEAHTTELDTGLHPHGAKWWRYRYEHSYIESVIMIFIVVLYLIWNLLTRRLMHIINQWSLPVGALPKTIAEEIAEESHGAMYKIWLHSLAAQMLVCVLVFLTVWSIAQTPLIHVIPTLIRPSKDMRVPTDGEEYKRLALDITTIFNIAIMFYFGLMLSVAHETRSMTVELESFDKQQTNATALGRDQGTPRRAGVGAVATSSEQWDSCKKHFIVHMSHEMQTVGGPEYMEIQRLLGGDLNKFPLWHYLRMNIRLTVVELFTFTWAMWLPVIVAFVIFMCLHRYQHMGYVRIMGFMGCFLLAIIGFMGWKVKSAGKMIQSEAAPNMDKKKKSIDEDYNTEEIWMATLQFSLFFLCYGVARTVCQPWMWELHFWPVLFITCLSVASAILFVLLVSPAIPGFCAVMALPPYVDPVNITMMRHVAQEVADGRHLMPTPR